MLSYMQNNIEDVEDINNIEDDIEDQVRKVNKFRKFFGYVSTITGVIITVVSLSTSGIIILPLVIGGYLIVNGLMSSFIKI